MPVLRKHDVSKPFRHCIDQGHDFVAARHCQAAAETEVVLDVDDEKRIVLANRQIFFQIVTFGLRQAMIDPRRHTMRAALPRLTTGLYHLGRAPLAQQEEGGGTR
jgi:hypothetical protein